jgi:SSS family solute:Na+ symporter
VIAAFFAAGLLLIVLGTGAGLVLGVTTNIYCDFLSNSQTFLKNIPPIRLLRLITLLVLLLASTLVFTGLDSTILKWSYMSMGLRGSAVFVGLLVLLLFKKHHHNKFILISLYSAPCLYVLFSFL